MKKLLIALALVGLVVGLVGCGSAASERNINIARQAVGIADEFLDGSITARAAHNRIDELSDIDTTRTSDSRANTDNLLLSTGVLILRTSLNDAALTDTTETYDRVMDARNILARRVGMRTR